MPFSPVAKIDHDRRQVFGWAKIAVQKDGSQEPDWQGDIVDTDVLEEAVYKFALDYRDAGANTRREYYTGKMIESVHDHQGQARGHGSPRERAPRRDGGWASKSTTTRRVGA
jgi:hypothetical protein